MFTSSRTVQDVWHALQHRMKFFCRRQTFNYQPGKRDLRAGARIIGARTAGGSHGNDHADNQSALWSHSSDGGNDAVCLFTQHLLQKFDHLYRLSAHGPKRTRKKL